ncbi:MAG: tRNA (adenosine(37)-N6)-dimethylallyltransferase MiaA [bacterium]|nr:tRNA (adenosine(37)-N6)-dimethylallyltransferase MiaA [bacterium]
MIPDKNSWQPLIKDHIKQSVKPLIVILGPTASGKTCFSVEIAKFIDAEIINADSRQLFTGMNIGTAKITQEEMQGVEHHLIDVFDPSERATSAWYKQEAEKIIDSLHEDSKIPILVGGSMLYIASITDGLSFDEEVRSQLRNPEAECQYDLLILGLGNIRSETVVKINNRTEGLFAAGWIDEVQRLVEKGYTKEDPGMKACGYREIMDYLESGSELEELKESIAAKTRQYARRQMTWWKGDTRINWL